MGRFFLLELYCKIGEEFLYSISKMEGFVMSVQKKESEKNKMDWSKFVDSKPKIIVVSVIAVILLLNIMWTLMQGKVTSESEAVRAELTKLEQRLMNLEERSAPDVESLRAEFDSIKKIGEDYEARLAALLKAEEERLASMKKEFEAREAWIESLKKTSSEGK